MSQNRSTARLTLARATTSPPSSEHALLDTLKKYLHFRPSRRYPVGVGDDCAVRRSAPGESLVLTTDSMVEQTHFSLRWMSFEELGYKAMAANVSDCAAMGARPESAMVELMFPSPAALRRNVDELYRGLHRACRRWNFPIIGGNLARGPCWAVSITMVGRMEPGRKPRLRTGAKVGDALWVSGNPGASAVGLEAVRRRGRKRADSSMGVVTRCHVAPKPPLEAAVLLARDSRVHAMVDISDGVAKEVCTMAYESKVGAILDAHAFPVSAASQRAAKALSLDALKCALEGGEDYELLVAAAPELDVRAAGRRCGVRFTRIGRVRVRGDGVGITIGGHYRRLLPGGWDHLGH